MTRGSWFISFALLGTGCTMPGYVKTAYYGDLPTLKSQITSASATGHMSTGNVVDLAEAVARRELRAARGDDALSRVLGTRGCVRAVEPELRERTTTFDDVGASAMLVLLEAGEVRRGPLVDRYGQSPSGAWRAVAARGTGSAEHATLRRAFYVDVDERVRREALHSALEAHDPADLDILLETARLDPDPMSRSIATRAVGMIGGTRASIGLADLWSGADDAEELAVVDAWSMPHTFSAGGAEALIGVAESGGSVSSVVAASELARAEGAGRREGRAALARAVKEGTTDERRLAIELVSLDDPDAVTAVDAAAASDDAGVRVTALARLAEVPTRRASALGQLKVIAAGNDSAARQARLALAFAADHAVVPLLERDLATDGPTSRARAAVALFRLGEPSKMAAALADADPNVRMSVACSVLSARPTSG